MELSRPWAWLIDVLVLSDLPIGYGDAMQMPAHRIVMYHHLLRIQGRRRREAELRRAHEAAARRARGGR